MSNWSMKFDCSGIGELFKQGRNDATDCLSSRQSQTKHAQMASVDYGGQSCCDSHRSDRRTLRVAQAVDGLRRYGASVRGRREVDDLADRSARRGKRHSQIQRVGHGGPVGVRGAEVLIHEGQGGRVDFPRVGRVGGRERHGERVVRARGIRSHDMNTKRRADGTVRCSNRPSNAARSDRPVRGNGAEGHRCRIRASARKGHARRVSFEGQADRADDGGRHGKRAGGGLRGRDLCSRQKGDGENRRRKQPLH